MVQAFGSRMLDPEPQVAGVVKKISNNQIDITELPIKKWTQDGSSNHTRKEHSSSPLRDADRKPWRIKPVVLNRCIVSLGDTASKDYKEFLSKMTEAGDSVLQQE